MTQYIISNRLTAPLRTKKPSLLDRFRGRRDPDVQLFDLTHLLHQYQYPDVNLVINGVDPTLVPEGVAMREDGTAFLYFRRMDASDNGALVIGTRHMLRSADIRRVRTDAQGTTVRFYDAWDLGRGVVHYARKAQDSDEAEAFLAIRHQNWAGFYRYQERLKRVV